MNNGAVMLFPSETVWDEMEMQNLMTAIRWFRSIGQPLAQSYEVSQEMITESLQELLDYLVAEQLLDNEIYIYAYEGAPFWTWRILPTAIGWAVWNNVNRVGETKGDPA